MNRTFSFALYLALYSAAMPVHAENVPGLLVPDYDVETLWPGVWKAQITKKTWFGVYCDASGCTIKPAKVTIKRGKMEADCGKQVAASSLQFSPANPLFLIDRMPAGTKIPRAELGVSQAGVRDTATGKIVWPLVFQEHHYQLALTDGYDANDAYACKNKGKLPISLTRDGKMESTWRRDICSLEKLTAMDIPTDYVVLWFGDLDGDGAPDVLLRLPSGGKMLLLSGSSEAEILFPLARDREFPAGDACP